MPYASFQGQFLHADLFEMAAAFAFHICQNHPSVDGNKRTALAAALVFLELNGISPDDPQEKLYHSMMSLASGNLDKAGLAVVLKELKEFSRQVYIENNRCSVNLTVFDGWYYHNSPYART
jgi:death on curing protein